MTEPTPEAREVAAQTLVGLSAQVLPVWTRHLDVLCRHSEGAVAEMLSAFSDIGPHLDMTTRQSQQITEALAQGDGGITQLARACDAVFDPVLGECTPQVAEAIDRAKEMIHRCVDSLEAMAKPFERETQLVIQQVDRMYRGFQYQDRLNQMVAILRTDVERLRKAIEDADTSLGPEQWLERLQSSYVMVEQFHHAGESHQNNGGEEETTFF
ncbi:hypothetical protein [Candidatus Symbiobacter mobilis]|uniref:Methyl-accepting chemotaxis protein n=1 Tax=Candidatus Symbiobacter mobilis CR TaxID=946483 RepID=U5N8L3_9BURK|nr:hypothetical protein [Candidatus Symbiobacter mobilis]AGX87866.1 hypothetical protein Cenrod_1782 [Candidatus Symbiobacter mobilis CR]